MSAEPSPRTTALQTEVASGMGVEPRVSPAVTLPFESTLTPVRSPPFRSASESSTNVRVPTACAGEGASDAAETASAQRARRAGEEVVERIMLVKGSFAGVIGDR